MNARCAALAAWVFAATALADEVSVPFALQDSFIESLVRQQMFPTGVRRLNDDGSGCQFLELRDPRVSAEPGRVILRTQAWARAGRAVGGRCLLVLDWRGELEFTQHPIIIETGRGILLRTVSWRARRADGSTATVSTAIGRWLDGFFGANRNHIQLSLEQPIDQLQDFLGLVVAHNNTAWRRTLIDSIAISAVDVSRGVVNVSVGMQAPTPSALAPRAEASLTMEELARLEQRLDAIDAFFTYAIKAVSRDSESLDSQALLSVLFELRHDAMTLLINPLRSGDDPARELFVKAWEALTPILATVTGQQTGDASTLRYMAFIGAGDALSALDDLGPAVNIDVSTPGLRRLARILLPDDPEDPLARDDAVDPEMREVLGFGPPLPPPQFFNESSWIQWFVPAAHAAQGLDSAIIKKLNNWVPKARDIDSYLPMVRDVLRYVVAEQLRSKPLDGTYHQLYRWLVLAAAWQESCWRQFVAKNDMRVPMESGSGDLGMMQINPKVWRGLYDLHGLRWDIVYNARAGADILQHYLIDYAIRHGEHRTPGGLDNLARSGYAAYNGGPRGYDRYRRGGVPAHAKKIDALFFEKYRAIKTGNELAVVACYRG